MARLQYNGKTLEFGGKSISFLSVSQTFDDWFLPSKDEMNLMYTNLYYQGVGDLSSSGYWTSSEASEENAATEAWIVLMNPHLTTTINKNSTYYVRACRSFTDDIGTYSLRDIGPAGGLIFYINGTTYYESAPSDQSSSQQWSNVSSTEIGTTGTSIGTGQQNTLNIINQAGHTDSAAKLCNDLVI